VHNPAGGREELLGVRTLRPASAKDVLVIGGGPAGLKAAEVAAMRGHTVRLLERDDHLGGQVHLAALAPGRAEWGEITRHLEARIAQLGVDVMLETEVTVDELLRSESDAIVVATGSKPAPAPFAVTAGARVLDEWQVMRASDLTVRRCVVVDLGGRYQAAAVVETMLSRGAEVVWVSTDMFIGARVDPTTFVRLKRRLADRTITEMAQTAVVAVDERSVSTVALFSGTMSEIPDVDCVVVVGNKQVDDALVRGLEGAGRSVHVVGDCLAPRHVTSAIYEGELAGRAI
jgi:NADPH-dependent 2,4-dienoyl-CoA reductase/sulfur reductase-like enzyme